MPFPFKENFNAPMGFILVGLQSSPEVSLLKFFLPESYTTPLALGDDVRVTDADASIIEAAGDNTTVVGVLEALNDPLTNKPFDYFDGTRDLVAWVRKASSGLWVIQESAATAEAAIPASEDGGTFVYTGTSVFETNRSNPDPVTHRSTIVMDSASGDPTGNKLIPVRLSGLRAKSAGAYQDWVVRFNPARIQTPGL